MRRGLGWMLVMVLLLGGSAACGSDDDGGNGNGNGTDTEADNGDDGNGGGGNETIAQFCDAVEEYVKKAEEAVADPTNTDLLNEVTEMSLELAEQAGELAAEAPNFTTDDAAQFGDCQDQLAEAG